MNEDTPFFLMAVNRHNLKRGTADQETGPIIQQQSYSGSLLPSYEIPLIQERTPSQLLRSPTRQLDAAQYKQESGKRHLFRRLRLRQGGTSEHQEQTRLLAYAQKLLPEYRRLLHLEPDWTIVIKVVCPELLPEQEGQVHWVADAWYAEILLRSDLSLALFAWDLAHELCELAHWRTGDAVFQLLSLLRENVAPNSTQYAVSDYYWRVYQERRNQEIERLLRVIFGRERPGHLLFV